MALASSSARRWLPAGLLGSGSFASVSLAVDCDTGELFAVKSAQQRDSSGRAALENELRILRSLSSPRIVRCLGSCSQPAREEMYLEYMPGGSLADLISKLGGLQETLVKVYTRSILEGLHYLHSVGIVHCDIKGKNILVSASGAVKLADFGSARPADHGSSSSSADCISGTPLWMAPEVARHEAQGCSADVWSLGCTVVEMLSGRPPWSDTRDPFVALYRIGCGDELPQAPEHVSAHCKDFLSRCFQRDPSKRWTAQQLLLHPFMTETLHEQQEQQQQERASRLEHLRLEIEQNSSSSSSGGGGGGGGGGSPTRKGKWVVVRSPSRASPSSPDPFNLLSDFDSISSSTDSVHLGQPAGSSVSAEHTVSVPTASDSSPVCVSDSGSDSVSASGFYASELSAPAADLKGDLPDRRAWGGGAEPQRLFGVQEETGSICCCYSWRIEQQQGSGSPAGEADEVHIGGKDMRGLDKSSSESPTAAAAAAAAAVSKLGSAWIHLKHRLLWRMLSRDELDALVFHRRKRSKEQSSCGLTLMIRLTRAPDAFSKSKASLTAGYANSLTASPRWWWFIACAILSAVRHFGIT